MPLGIFGAAELHFTSRLAAPKSGGGRRHLFPALPLPFFLSI